MTPKSVARGIVVAVFASVLVISPVLAGAQSARGGLGGKIVGPAGEPVVDAEVVLENTDVNLRYITKTDSSGEWAYSGLPVGYRITIAVTKGDLVGGMSGIPVRQGSVVAIPDIVLSVAAGSVTALESAEAEAARAMQEAMDAIAEEVNAAIDTGNFDLAIGKINEAIVQLPECGLCYEQIGSLYLEQSKLDEAETALLKAAELDPASLMAFSNLASIYNQRQDYEAAEEMNAKVQALGPAGGGDATGEFSAGAIAVNLQLTAEREGNEEVAAEKMAEAEAHFLRAIELKPDMVEAYYELGMLFVKQNKIPEAKQALAEYVRLAPDGPNAEMAKAIASMP